jgi:uncharacterized protein
MAEFEIYKDERLDFRWRFKANNGRILAESAEGYNNPASCEHAILHRESRRRRVGESACSCRAQRRF